MKDKPRKIPTEIPSTTNRRELIGAAIRDRRNTLKLRQPELAKRIGKSVATVSKIESGLHPLDVDTLSQVATALDTSTTRLLWESQRTRLSESPETHKMVPLLDSLLDSLEKSGIKF